MAEDNSTKKDFLKPYKGDKPYVFISYAHKNMEEAKVIISHLQSSGYRVWYDEGIDPGTEWDENIAYHIEECSVFIALISHEYIESTNCRDEINYARDIAKKRLVIYLQGNVEMPSGMNMRISRLQNIHKYKYSDESVFYEKLYESDGLELCLETGDGEPDLEGDKKLDRKKNENAIINNTPELRLKKQRKKKRIKIISIAALSAVVIIALIGAFMLIGPFGKKKSVKKNEGSHGKYEKYLGFWRNDSFSNAHFEYFEKLEILSAKGNEIVFNLTKVNYNPDISSTIFYQKAILTDGYGDFTYRDDKTEETGTGQISLKDDKVYLSVDCNEDTDSSQFDITMDTGFTQTDRLEKGEVFPLEEMIGDFEMVCSSYGSRERKERNGKELIYYYAGGGLVAHLTDGVNVTEVDIDYTKLKSDYKYTYRRIDNSISKSEYKKIMEDKGWVVEEPSENELYIYDTAYYSDVYATFGENNKLEKLRIIHHKEE